MNITTQNGIDWVRVIVIKKLELTFEMHDLMVLWKSHVTIGGSLYKTPTRLQVPETQRYVFCCPMEWLVVLCRGHNSHQCVCVGIVNFFVGDDVVRSGWDRDNVTFSICMLDLYLCRLLPIIHLGFVVLVFSSRFFLFDDVNTIVYVYILSIRH